MWVGRLEHEKNPLEFMTIVAAVIDARPSVRALMIGDTFGDAEYEAWMARLAAIGSARVSGVTFRRSVPYGEMPSIYSLVARSGGCLVSTSLFESAPMTFIEAALCGCPVLGAEMGGVADALEGGRTGRLYRPGDIDGAVKEILGLIDGAGQPERHALVDRARAAVTERHAPERIGRQYREMLESLPARVEKASTASSAFAEPGADGQQNIPGLVSTIIPVYNRARLLREAVASVLAQTYRSFEIIIVDDGSTDETAAACDELAREHQRIRVLHLPHQGRAGLAREAGRRVARGEFIQYLDSDDLIMPAKFAALVTLLELNPECDIAYCGTRRYRLGETPLDTPAALTGDTFHVMLPAFVARRYWETSTPIYRRRLCDKGGPWSDLLIWEDIEHDIRLATFNPRLCHCPELLTDMRDHDDGRLSSARLLEDPALLSEAIRASARIYGHLKSAGLGYTDPYVRCFVDDLRLFYNRSVDLGLSDQADQCARLLSDATGSDDRQAVGRYSLAALIEPDTDVVALRPAQSQCCRVRVTNQSSVAFHGGECGTLLSYHLLQADGSMLRFHNPIYVTFNQPLSPGESRIVDLWVRAPNVGRSLLRLAGCMVGRPDVVERHRQRAGIHQADGGCAGGRAHMAAARCRRQPCRFAARLRRTPFASPSGKRPLQRRGTFS